MPLLLPCDKVFCARKIAGLERASESVRSELATKIAEFERANETARLELESSRVTLSTRNGELTSLHRQFNTTTTQAEQLKIALANMDAQMKTTLADRDAQLTFLLFQFSSEQGIPRTDVAIVVQDCKTRLSPPLHAHRHVLADRSSVFSKMFESEMTAGNRIVIEDTTFPVMRAVIEFCYDAEIDFTDEVTAEAVLAVAHKYDINFLQEVRDEHLCTTIDSENLPRLLTLATKFGAKGLIKKSNDYFKNHFDEVIGDVTQLL